MKCKILMEFSEDALIIRSNEIISDGWMPLADSVFFELVCECSSCGTKSYPKIYVRNFLGK